jgi:2-polyprenyl-3-methyl-5-hydroxy-6-metoxy-1,4-benzoquinol methylase
MMRRNQVHDPKTHWDGVYDSKQPSEVSWYQPHLLVSFELIVRSGITQSDHIIDVGGGTSTLVDDLLDRGFRNLTVLDISSKAIDITRARLGTRSAHIHWIVDDVLHAPLEQGRYRIWHDRAVLHFLTNAEARRTYVEQVRHAVCPGGFVAISTFSLDGPSKCSGLEVCRYSRETLLAEFGPRFRLIESRSESHRTPTGTAQAFLYCLLSFEGFA